MVQTAPPQARPRAHRRRKINDFASEQAQARPILNCLNNNIIANGAALVSAPLKQIIAIVLGAQPSILTVGVLPVGKACRSARPRIMRCARGSG
jgi:hypothetical protein